MSELLKNKYFFNEKSPRYILIPEKDDFLKGKCPKCLNFWKIRTLSKENPLKNFWGISALLKENFLVLPEFLKNKYFVKGKSLKNVWTFPLKMSEFLKNRYFFNEKSPSYILFPEKDDFLGNSQSYTWMLVLACSLFRVQSCGGSPTITVNTLIVIFGGNLHISIRFLV
jgi:hypothetical protein